jgi:hypothetical protein
MPRLIEDGEKGHRGRRSQQRYASRQIVHAAPAGEVHIIPAQSGTEMALALDSTDSVEEATGLLKQLLDAAMGRAGRVGTS